MKPTKDVLSARLAEEAVLLDLKSKQYYRLNESAAVIYRAIEEGLGRDGAIARLLETFDVDDPTAANAVDQTLKDLEARKLLEQQSPEPRQ